ncbi:hypothetical protein [Lysinibacillus sp. 3P01SB]|uniref:hypothetical protein n=1 Tax=Lysinibacillus sp. 3P01SB TaxID=3132284 RepID=UPI0039A508D2
MTNAGERLEARQIREENFEAISSSRLSMTNTFLLELHTSLHYHLFTIKKAALQDFPFNAAFKQGITIY